MMKKLISYFSHNPKTLFLVDGIGALMTAFSLFVILPCFNDYIGMPQSELTFLSAIALCFCIYSLACFLFLKGAWATYLRYIGMANLSYCVLTLGLILIHYSLLTVIGISYFLIEIAIVCSLASIELKLAANMK